MVSYTKRAARTAFAAAALAAALASAGSVSWPEWKAAHGRAYPSSEEDAYRAKVFAANLAIIDAHNAGGHGWSMAANKMADLTSAEFAARYTSGRVAAQRRLGAPAVVATELLQVDPSSLPTSVNWTAQGVVTPVKNQGDCGSCWAFSVVSCVESITAIKTGKLYSLSEQQVIDCDKAAGNDGCNGGDQLPAFKWLAGQAGLCTEASYPYTAKNGKCQTTCTPVASINGGAEVPKLNETALMAAIAAQPTSVSVDAAGSNWQFYSGGVMSGTCGTSLDHAVTAEGYGTDASGNDFYLVRNSWGTDWGISGYILMGRGSSFSTKGLCGIQMDSSFPIKN